MQSTLHTYAAPQSQRHVSLSKLSVILANLALWATFIGGVALALR